MSDKTQLATDTPAGAALIAQAMDRREGTGRHRAMQSIMDWDRSRLAYRAVKRAFDIVFSGVVLVVIAIPSLVLAALIRLESEGSPFYSQIRVGQTRPDGSLSTFRMWKFRSMYKDADERLAELREQNEIAGAMFKMREDPALPRSGSSSASTPSTSSRSSSTCSWGRCPSWARARRCRMRLRSTPTTTCSALLLSRESPARGRSLSATRRDSTGWSVVTLNISPNEAFSSI